MDIEWKIKAERKNWPSSWKTIDVYPDELIIYFLERNKDNNIINNTLLSIHFFENTFGDSFDATNNCICLQFANMKINIIYEMVDEENTKSKHLLPLFKNSFYKESIASEFPLTQLKVPVIAFHSYKGGVGRTLSLIALLRELSQNKDFKALIVDADIEAPGLTLMTKNYGFPSEKRISYADILSIIHDSETNNLFNDNLYSIANSMINSTIIVPGTNINTEHYFIPAYRFDYQLLDNFVHPETIVSMPERPFIIQEYFSKLGEELKVNVVLIDLRAGFSELSAPFLFDPRIKRVFVTTTSKQSVDGTKHILNEVINSSFSPLNERNTNITILLTNC